MLFLTKSSEKSISHIQASPNDRLLKDDLNSKNDTSFTKSAFDLGGGKQKWKEIIPCLSQNINQDFPTGKEMVKLEYELKNIKRTEFPIFLDPNTASFIDVGIHAKIRQFLADATITKNLRYARFMERSPVPIDFRNLIPEQFIRHMDYRIEVENASPFALAHEKKAIIMFLRAYGIDTDRWKIVCKTPPITVNEDNIEVPFPTTVNKFFSYDYGRDKYENVLLQSIAFIGFMFGMRPPSEICNLNYDDLKLNDDGTGTLTVHEQKKRNKNRIIIPFNKTVLSSPVFKTPRNYRDNWRHKVENSNSGNALFLQPNGKRITGRYITAHLTLAGKKIAGDYFHLYTMRHTYASYLYDYTGDIKFVSKMLGHTKITNTSKYIHTADCIKRQLGKRNLFNLALRSHNIENIYERGKEKKIDCLAKINQSNKVSPVEQYGPGRIRTGDLRRVRAMS